MERHHRLSRRLRLRDLSTLATVVRRGSMAKAAAELALTQPAVSKAIADMERALGVRLLERKPTGVEPTPCGEALLKCGDAVFEDVRRAMREIEYLKDPEAGEVSVGGTNPVVDGLLPAVVDRLSLRFPRIVVKVRQVPITQQHYDELRARKLDLLVGRMPSTFAERDLLSEQLFEEPLFVVAGARNQWARRRRIELEQLLQELWVLPGPETAVGSFIRELFRASDLEFPPHGVTCSGLQFTRALIETGRYLGMLPASFLHFSGKGSSLKVLPVELPLKPPPVGMITARNRTLNPAAAQFVSCLHAVAKPLVTNR